MTLDDWLARIYKADIRGNREAEVEEFKDALAANSGLMFFARARLRDYDELIAARTEQACAYSTKYRTYLQEALA